MPTPTAEAVESPKRFAGPAFASVRRPAAAGAARLVLTGELDLVTAARARAAIRRAQAESRVLICDLGDLWFIDLTGLRVLLSASAHAKRTGRQLIVANAPPSLSRLLRVLGLAEALDVAAAPFHTPSTRSRAASRAHAD